MSVGQMIMQLSKAYIALAKADLPFRLFPSVMLWGAPGVGKSAGVKQLAAIIEESTGKKVTVTDVRLLLFNPIDLRGIPAANADHTLAVWLKPQIFEMDASPDAVNILFLDEISAAPPSVQAAAYQITLDRKIGEHRLPDNCIVIAAGNRVTDRSVAYAMPHALANRMCHITIESDKDSWHAWAVENGMHELVTGFIDMRPDRLLEEEPPKETVAYPTPRSWEMVSHILQYVSNDVKEVFPLIEGCVGAETALEFRLWSQTYYQLPSSEKICAGTEMTVPLSPEARYALVSKLVAHVRTHPNADTVSYAVRYAYRLPEAFRAKMFYDLLRLKRLRPYLETNDSYRSWMEENNARFE